MIKNQIKKALDRSTELERIQISGNYGGLEVNIDIPNEERKFGQDCNAFYKEKGPNSALFFANDSLVDEDYLKGKSDFFDGKEPVYHFKIRPLAGNGFTLYGSAIPILSKHGLQNTSMNDDRNGNVSNFYSSMNGIFADIICGRILTALFDRPNNRLLDFELKQGTNDNPYILCRDSSGKLLVFARGQSQFPSYESLIAECKKIYGSLEDIKEGFVDKSFVKDGEFCAKLKFHGGTEDTRVAMMVEQRVCEEVAFYMERVLGYS